MAVKSNHVTIKGIKDGLVFLLDDQCEFENLLGELRFKLEHSHQNILTGPIIHVDIKLGSREVTEEQKESILEILKQRESAHQVCRITWTACGSAGKASYSYGDRDYPIWSSASSQWEPTLFGRCKPGWNYNMYW